jgi:hypothetical protein
MQVDAADFGDAQQVVLRRRIATLGVGDGVFVNAKRRGERLLALGAADEAQPLTERHRRLDGGTGRKMSKHVCCIFVSAACKK